MKKQITPIFITAIITTLLHLSSCSTASLQSDRLDSAESYIVRAEKIMTNSSRETEKNLAEENLGTAKAYLETLRDNRKFLTKNEHKRRQELIQRANKLSKLITK